MDAARYSRLRELFLAAEELPEEQRADFLRLQTSDDTELFEEVCSLLDEHDPDAARSEGEKATPVMPPSPLVANQATAERSEHSDRTMAGEGSTQPRDDSRRDRRFQSEITQHGAQRTHAAPRYSDSTAPAAAPSLPIWAKQRRQRRRSNSRWLWLAALLPTALIGWWAFAQVQSTLRESVRNELAGVADSVSLAVDQFFDDKAMLVQSWSRQPAIQQTLLEMLAPADPSPPVSDSASATIDQQLRMISGSRQLQYVLWDDSYIAVAASSDAGVQLGEPVPPSGAADLNRVMRGETVRFGPRRRGDADRSNAVIEMAIIVPVRQPDGRVVAALAVGQFGLFEQFNRIFASVSEASGLDAYAIDERGIMLSQSPLATTLAENDSLPIDPTKIPATLRVADPGVDQRHASREVDDQRAFPLTIAAASATSQQSEVRIEPYGNYAGTSVVGAWRWNAEWNLGVVIEMPTDTAFAAANIVRFSFLLLASVLSLTAFAAAAMIAGRSARDHAAVHPLSRYELIGELGSGGMGTVYHARHRQLGRETALKVLRGDRQNKEDRLRFDREARLAASLSNPHSVMIYDYGRSEEGEAYCVMEFLRGLTLAEVVARSGHQPFGRVLFILSQICDALAEAHQLNLLHRDIKPQNVMLSLDASVGDWAVVFDYGLAKPFKPEGGLYQTSETSWAGTPMYMPPERFRTPSQTDPRSDIYSVGCVAYYLLAGRPPFIECDPESMFALIITQQPIDIATHRDAAVPEAIDLMVKRCMAKNSDERYATVHELSHVIDALRAEHPWTVDDARQWWRTFGDE